MSLLCAHGQPLGSLLDLTYGECAEIAQAMEKRVRAEQEQQAAIAWKTAEMVGQYIAAMFGKNAPKPQSLYEAFPWIEQPEPDWRELKARMSARAAAHNARITSENVR